MRRREETIPGIMPRLEVSLGDVPTLPAVSGAGVAAAGGEGSAGFELLLIRLRYSKTLPAVEDLLLGGGSEEGVKNGVPSLGFGSDALTGVSVTRTGCFSIGWSFAGPALSATEVATACLVGRAGGLTPSRLRKRGAPIFTGDPFSAFFAGPWGGTLGLASPNLGLTAFSADPADPAGVGLELGLRPVDIELKRLGSLGVVDEFESLDREESGGRTGEDFFSILRGEAPDFFSVLRGEGSDFTLGRLVAVGMRLGRVIEDVELDLFSLPGEE
jgi:hypothetical protein